MFDLRLVEDGSNRNVVFGLGLTKVPDMDLVCGLKRGIRGLLKVQAEDIDEGVIVYSIAHRIQLSQMLSAGVSEKTFMLCFSGILRTMRRLEILGLDLSNLVIDPKFIFFDVKERQYEMIMLPIKNSHMDRSIGSKLLLLIGSAKFIGPVDRIAEVAKAISVEETDVSKMLITLRNSGDDRPIKTHVDEVKPVDDGAEVKVDFEPNIIIEFKEEG